MNEILRAFTFLIVLLKFFYGFVNIFDFIRVDLNISEASRWLNISVVNPIILFYYFFIDISGG